MTLQAPYRPLRTFPWLLLLLLLGWGAGRPARGQQLEWSRWYFGNRAALRFTPDSAVALADSRMQTASACASLSDSAGHLLVYSNGARAWNGRHQLLRNSAVLGGDSVSSQGCVLVPRPGQAGRYYLFTLDTWLGRNPRRGLRMAELDVAAAGGQGEVIRSNQPVVPDTLLQRLGGRDFMEQAALVRHPDGRSWWLLTHLLDTNLFLSIRIDGTGFFRNSVVLSHAGRVRTLLPGNANSHVDGLGSLAVSPDGRRLALNSLINGCEVFDFDPATGQVSSPIFLGFGIYSFGVAFSPNSRLLYCSRQGPNQGPNTGDSCVGNAITEVRQFDVTLPAAAVAASAAVVYNGCGAQVWGLQQAPNGLLYAANLRVDASGAQVTVLDVIRQPNARGAACQYSVGGLALGAGRWPTRNFPVVPSLLPAQRLLALEVVAGAAPGAGGSLTACVGTAVLLRAIGPTLGAPGDSLEWDFGDGQRVRTVQQQLSHAYAQPGRYTVRVRLRNHGQWLAQRQLELVMSPVPTVNLGPDLLLCAGQSAALSAGAQAAGTRMRWQDGSTAPTLTAAAPGLYWAEAESAAGCVVRDSLRLAWRPQPVLVLAADGSLCADQSVLLGAGPQAANARYQWQDGSAGSTLRATLPGRYRLTVISPDGCARQASLELAYDNAGGCPLLTRALPNIITPNGDPANEFFVLRGLNAPDWNLTVFNRWGREVFHQPAYDNRWNAAGQPAGVYYYRLVNAAAGQHYKGWLEVVR